MKTKNPTIKQVQVVIDKFKTIEEAANRDGAFDIKEDRVNNLGHVCGTVHCVMGWYAIASMDDEGVRYKTDRKMCNYIDGGAVLGRDLGFSDRNALKLWAGRNPSIWGNYYGGAMDISLSAYNGLTRDSKNPMSIIIKQWEGVRGNLHLRGWYER